MPGSPPPAPLARLATPITVRVGPALAGGKVVEGSALISTQSPIGQRAGKSLRTKIIIWSFKLGQWIRGEIEKDAQKREYQQAWDREQWRVHMMGVYWKNLLGTDLPLVAANAFDQLAGGNASNGVVPAMTSEAMKAEQQMMHEISDRWRGYLDDLRSHEAALVAAKQGAWGYGAEQDAKIRSLTQGIAQLNAKMQADLEAVVAHECNPANWELTAEQTALLPDIWRERFERKTELEDSVATGRASESAREELAALKDEMSAEAGSLYEYGPEVAPEEHQTTTAPQYGPAKGGGPFPGP